MKILQPAGWPRPRGYREVMAADGIVPWPAMTAVRVSALIEDRAKVEIEATAVIPDPA